MKKSIVVRGFTLIELVIVIAVIGILAAFAIPAYTQYIERGWRAEARANLLETAQMMERYHSVNNTYVQNSNPIPLTDCSRFKVELENATAASYTLRAEVKNVTACDTLTLTNTGEKRATGGTVAECWGK